MSNLVYDPRDRLDVAKETIESLRAWQERALPFLEGLCEEQGEYLAMREPFKEDGFMTQELHDSVTKDLEENHAILRELIKEQK
jgi:hypothetical protein